MTEVRFSPRDIPDLLLVSVVAATVVGLVLVAAGVGVTDVVPIPTPAGFRKVQAVSGGANGRRDAMAQDQLAGIVLEPGRDGSASPIPPQRPAQSRVWRPACDAFAGGDAPLADMKGDPRLFLTEMAQASRERNVTGLQEAIGHGYAP